MGFYIEEIPTEFNGITMQEADYLADEFLKDEPCNRIWDVMRALRDFYETVISEAVETATDTADTPQNEQMKTADYCDICKQDMCKDCIADATNPYCVPSHYEINYEPKDEPKTQMKTQNSNLTFEKRTMLDCYNCKRYKNDDACVECRYEPIADTPQTDCDKCIWSVCNYNEVEWDADTPQTESTGSPIGDYRDGVGSWQTDRMTEEEFDTKLAKVLVGQTDCGWGEPRNE